MLKSVENMNKHDFFFLIIQKIILSKFEKVINIPAFRKNSPV